MLIWRLLIAIAAGAGIARADGQGIFVANCAVCHQPDGHGVASIYPPLADSVQHYIVMKEGRRYLVHVVSFGMAGPIKAHGQSWNGVMQAWTQLNDADVAAVLDYVLTNLGTKPASRGIRPFDAREVSALRSKPMSASDVRAERDTLMKELAKDGLPQ